MDVTTSIDYGTLFDQRDSQFREIRATIINDGVGLHDEKTLNFINALKDYGDNIQHTLNSKVATLQLEIQNLRSLGNEMVEKQTGELKAAAQAELEKVVREQTAGREMEQREAQRQLEEKQQEITDLRG